MAPVLVGLRPASRDNLHDCIDPELYNSLHDSYFRDLPMCLTQLFYLLFYEASSC